MRRLRTADALSRIYRKGSISFGGLKDPGFQMKRLEIGGCLNAAELLCICTFVGDHQACKSLFQRKPRRSAADSLDVLFAGLEPLTPLLEEIRRSLLAEDEISDDASPALHSVRRTIRNINDKIHGAMNNLFKQFHHTVLFAGCSHHHAKRPLLSARSRRSTKARFLA